MNSWQWPKFFTFIGSLLFAGGGLVLIFCYFQTENTGKVLLQDIGIARELVLTSAIFSIMLAIPMLVMFAAFEKLNEIKSNPRGHLVILNSPSSYRLEISIIYCFFL